MDPNKSQDNTSNNGTNIPFNGQPNMPHTEKGGVGALIGSIIIIILLIIGGLYFWSAKNQQKKPEQTTQNGATVSQALVSSDNQIKSSADIDALQNNINSVDTDNSADLKALDSDFK